MNNKSSPYLKLVVAFNGQQFLDYDREKPLTEKQFADLEIMETKLEKGFEISGHQVLNPSPEDKATYVANLLAHAIINNEEPAAAITCTYLATHHPDLKQIKISTKEDKLSIQMIFDEEYQESVAIQFVPKKDLI